MTWIFQEISPLFTVIPNNIMWLSVWVHSPVISRQPTVPAELQLPQDSCWVFAVTSWHLLWSTDWGQLSLLRMGLAFKKQVIQTVYIAVNVWITVKISYNRVELSWHDDRNKSYGCLLAAEIKLQNLLLILAYKQFSFKLNENISRWRNLKLKNLRCVWEFTQWIIH